MENKNDEIEVLQNFLQSPTFEEKIQLILNKYNEKSPIYIKKKATGTWFENKEWGLLKFKEHSELREVCINELKIGYNYLYHRKLNEEYNNNILRYGYNPNSNEIYKPQVYACTNYEKIRLFWEKILIPEMNEADKCVNYNFTIPNWKPQSDGFFTDNYGKTYHKSTLEYAVYNIDLCDPKKKYEIDQKLKLIEEKVKEIKLKELEKQKKKEIEKKIKNYKKKIKNLRELNTSDSETSNCESSDSE